MGLYVQILALTIVGIILLWFGYTLFLGPLSPFKPGWFSWGKWGKFKKQKGNPDDPQFCPVCSLKLFKGELVKSVAFPSLTGGRDRLMYIKGCFSCLNEDAHRQCPICRSNLSLDDYLVSRMFERVGRKNHVHVLGCNKCKL